MSDDRLRALEQAWRKSGAPVDEAAWLRERARSGDPTLGRITFPGNPWPGGHRLEELTWSGRLTERGVWFDLELKTVHYDADDPPGADDDDGGGSGDWQARIVWGNYHRCTISSNTGVLVGTEAEPLDLDRLEEREWSVDPMGPDTTAADLEHDDLAFHVYLLGHDMVADHRLRFAPREDPSSWWLRWSGRVALTYAGHDAFEHTFELSPTLVRFEGIKVQIGPGGEAEARARLARFVARPDAWHFGQHQGTWAWFCPEQPTASRP